MFYFYYIYTFGVRYYRICLFGVIVFCFVFFFYDIGWGGVMGGSGIFGIYFFCRIVSNNLIVFRVECKLYKYILII